MNMQPNASDPATTNNFRQNFISNALSSFKDRSPK
jgi:hypothetical protein